MIRAAVMAIMAMTTISGNVDLTLADKTAAVFAPVAEVEEITAEEMKTQEEAPVSACELEESGQRYVGEYLITYYCPCSTCNGGWSGTASGAPLTPGYTVACPDFSFGTTILIDGVGYRCVQDLGVGSGQIDVCVGSHEEAYALGMHYSSVYIVG